jgi:hypothetical protein
MISLLLQILIAPIAMYSTTIEAIDVKNLPTYTGDPNDPAVTVVYSSTDYVIVCIKGKYYVIKK